MLEASLGALTSLGWSDRVAALFASSASGPDDRPARVVRVERSHSVVVGADGADRLATAPDPPVVGDWVAVAAGGVIREVLPRWSQLTRRDPDGSGLQVLAGNLDLVLVTAPADRLSPARVERELAAAWDSGATPVVLLTKSDLAAAGTRAGLAARLAGVDVLAASATTGEGVDQVAELLQPCRTAVLLGPSGAGKSSLANAVLGSDRFATADVREGDHRGRHTTASRQLVAVPGGGVLIDTPGLRSLGLAGGDGIGSAFPEIEELAGECRFGDCSHDVEPGCAVAAAIGAGRLDPARLRSFRKLQREAGREAARYDPLQRAASAKVWKRRAKANRTYDKRRLH